MAYRPSFTGATWKRACTGGDCVEVAFQDGCVGVRDGKQGDAGSVLTFTRDEWRRFVDEVKAGMFDVP